MCLSNTCIYTYIPNLGLVEGKWPSSWSKPSQALAVLNSKPFAFFEAVLPVFTTIWNKEEALIYISHRKRREIEMVSAREIKSNFGFSIHYFWKNLSPASLLVLCFSADDNCKGSILNCECIRPHVITCTEGLRLHIRIIKSIPAESLMLSNWFENTVRAE